MLKNPIKMGLTVPKIQTILFSLKQYDTKGIAYHNWMYLEINIPDIRLIPLDHLTFVNSDSFCLIIPHIVFPQYSIDLHERYNKSHNIPLRLFISQTMYGIQLAEPNTTITLNLPHTSSFSMNISYQHRLMYLFSDTKVSIFFQFKRFWIPRSLVRIQADECLIHLVLDQGLSLPYFKYTKSGLRQVKKRSKISFSTAPFF